MARSILEIYDSIVAEKNSMSTLKDLQPQADSAQTLLTDITSISRVSDWRLWVWLMAVSIHAIEVARDIFRAEIDQKVILTKAHTLRWYQKICLDFRYGYALAFNDELEKYEYPEAALTDANATVVTRAATEEANGRVIIKVANESGKLPTLEFDAFKAYMAKIKDAGTDLLMISTDADQVKCELEVYYDPLVLKPDGTLILDSARKPVEEQIEAYLKGVGFNGAFVNTDFVDFLQKAEGVTNPVRLQTQISNAIDPYAVIDVEYLPYSGYYEWDSVNTIITYRPANV
mgnify:CR=1 FL=1